MYLDEANVIRATPAMAVTRPGPGEPLSEGPEPRDQQPASTVAPETPRPTESPEPSPPGPLVNGPEQARLIALAQQGDTVAFARLIGVYQSKIYGFARAYCSDPNEAADLAQEALIKVYRSLHSFRFQSSLLTWMFRIVKNVALDHFRSRQQRERRREQPLEGLSEGELRGGSAQAAPGLDPEDHLLADEERQALWAALARVPEVYRTVVVLTDMQGLSYEEVAAIVGTPVGTVKSRLNRGRDALREVWLAAADSTVKAAHPNKKERA